MKSITEIITPIKLLSGSHSDTAQTGSGCFMNVIAYLNGENQITDQSPCVCIVVRPTLIWCNDMLADDQRQEMVPFIERAMGSATTDFETLKFRLDLLVNFAQNMAKHASQYAQYAQSAKYAAQYDAAQYAQSASQYAQSAAQSAYQSAQYAAKYAAQSAQSASQSAQSASHRNELKNIAFAFFDAALPKAQPISCEIIKRAESFVALTCEA